MTRENLISATDLARTLSDVLSRVRFGGERFVVQRGGRVVAAVVPADQGPRAVTPREIVEALSGFELPGEGFADDLEAVQNAQGQPEAPWS
jgi:antitoxin (DNA-binding transcriptional repressor) of toxin-antitoxin stability system